MSPMAVAIPLRRARGMSGGSKVRCSACPCNKRKLLYILKPLLYVLNRAKNGNIFSLS